MLRTSQKPSSGKKTKHPAKSTSAIRQKSKKLTTFPKRNVCRITSDPLRSQTSPSYNQIQVEDTMLRGSLIHTSNLLYQGMITSEQLVESTIDQIKDTNPITNAYISTSYPSALEEAEDSAIRYKKNTSLSPLDGIPIAIKDNIHVQNGQTTAGSQFLKGFKSPYNATIVDRLRKSGAIIVGKTNLDEFGMGSYGLNSSYNATKSIFSTQNQSNPDSQYVPGGSSSGSAVALQQYTAFASIGTDTGGSVRLPAAFTGTVGFKPTYGVLSRYGLIAYGSSFDCPGIMTRTVADAKIVFDEISGPDVNDSTCIFEPKGVQSHFPQLENIVPTVTNPNRKLKLKQLSNNEINDNQLPSKPFAGLKVGIPVELMFNDLSPEIKTIWNNTATLFKDLGAEIYSVSLPTLQHCLPIYYILAQSEAVSNLARYDGLRYGNTHYTNELEYQIGFYKKNIQNYGHILDNVDIPLKNTPKDKNPDQVINAIHKRSTLSATGENKDNSQSGNSTPENSKSIPNVTPLQKLYSTNRELFFGEEVKQRLLVGNFVLSSTHYNSYIEKSMALREELCHEFNDILYSTILTPSERPTSSISSQNKVDVILCPTSTVIPPTISAKLEAKNDQNSGADMAGYIDDVMTVFANLVGAPAVSLPVDTVKSPKTGEKLPIGMQLIGALASDRQLLDIGSVLQGNIKL
jgi:Asp-tRNA(Asn)/Glu-tRNA(Gln) amidotransferase A subunit family amidase